MKNVLILLLVAVATIFFASCKKCSTCRNQCEVCRKARHDTTLTILIYSQNLTEQYYTAYIDSLTSPALGWICKDTSSNLTEQVCETPFSDAALVNEKNKGFLCTPN